MTVTAIIILIKRIIMTNKLIATVIIKKQQRYRQYRPTKQTPFFQNRNP